MPNSPNNPYTSKAISGLVLLVSALIAITALYGIWLALFASSSPAFPMLGFELVVLIASILGFSFSFGKNPQAPALGHACVAGAVFACSVLAAQSVNRAIGTHSLVPLILIQLALSAAMLLLGVIIQLNTNKKNWTMLFTGALLSLIPLGVAGSLLSPWAGKVTGLFTNMSTAPKMIILTLGVLTLGIFFSVGIHLLVQAFNHTATDQNTTAASA